jgi:GT2 family glycosyltransferase
MLEELLASLTADLSDSDEAIVVDSASSTDDSRRVAERHHATYVRMDRPGASRARNAGWLRARNEVVAFIDDDCVVPPGWIQSLQAAMADPDIAFVTGRVEAPPGYVAKHLPVALVLESDGRLIGPDFRGTVGSSNNLAVRRAALESIGGFDERLGPATFFAAAEDVDLFDRLVAQGYVGKYDPSVLVWHKQWRTKAARVRIGYRYGKGMGGRLAKLARTNPERSKALRHDAVYVNGVQAVARDVRNRYEYGVLLDCARLLGTYLGLVAGRFRL